MWRRGTCCGDVPLSWIGDQVIPVGNGQEIIGGVAVYGAVQEDGEAVEDHQARPI